MRIQDPENARLWARRRLQKTISAILVMIFVRSVKRGHEIDIPPRRR